MSSHAIEPVVLAPSVPASRFALGRKGSRITSLVGWTLASGLVVTVVIAGLVFGPRVYRCSFGFSKTDIARLTVKKYADEAYPAFAAANAPRICPFDLYELGPWMNLKHPLDPWGTPYMMTCGTTSIAVASLGEDRQLGTADDIWSNE